MPATPSTLFFRLSVMSWLRCIVHRGVLALALFAATGFATAAHADTSDVLKAIQQHGHARVLLRMRGAHAGWTATAPAARQATAVEAALGETQSALDVAHVRNYRRFHTLPYVAADVDREQLLSLAASPAVEAIQLVTLERHLGSTALEVPQDAASVASIDVSNAWAQGFDGTGYAVAVIDGGFNLAHPMLAGKAVGEACFSRSYGTTETTPCPTGGQIAPGAASNCPSNSTRCNHGTHVASIAVGNDGTNFGVARGAKLVPIDVFSTDTDPNDCSPDPVPCEVTDSLAVLDALDYVNAHTTDYNIAAVNVSIGGSVYSGYCDDDPRKTAIDMLRAKGIAVAIAAGNDGDNGQVEKPGCISTAETVGASDDGTTVSSFTNFATMVDFMAPGVSVSGASGTGSGFITLTGTSMAAPHVAGAWAILRQAFPTASFDMLESTLKQTGLPTTRAGVTYSVPKIQVAAAISYLQGRNRGIVNSVASSANVAVGQSYLRFFNKSATAGTVSVALRDGTSGAVVANWTSPTIPGGASPQYGLADIERTAAATAGVLPIVGRAYYNIDITATFAGYLQHVQWDANAGIFNNLTSCGTGIVNDQSVIPNVHSSRIASYVSHIRLVNTGALTDHAVLVITDVNTGAQIAQWTSPDIASSGTLEITGPQLEAQVPALAAAVAGGLLQYNVTLTHLAGYMQHIMENQAVGVLSDLTEKCALTVVPASTTTTASNSP